jgi:putative FmdB family regulatory protein
MPTYDYGCDTCGSFSESHPMAEFAQPQPCPGCGDPAPRIVVTAPALGGNAAPQAAAMPQRMHPGGCGCCAPRRLSAEAV